MSASHTVPLPQLIITLGPASFDSLDELIRVGIHAVRLNGSHMDARTLEHAVRRIRNTSPMGVIVDLQGAKMRFGTFVPRTIHAGQSLTFSHDAHDAHDTIPVVHPELYRDAHVGDTLRCDDDRIRFRIDEVTSDHINVTCLSDGVLHPRKGVNVVEHPVHLDDLSHSDVQQIEAVRPFDDITFACSFMRDGREAAWVRQRAPHAAIIGKVERAEAMDAIDSISASVDAVWICRGDLGAQVGLATMARWIGAFQPASLPVPTFMAGQVLEHLTHHANPTRSEVCHLHDLLQRGYAGIVLSDETAIGLDPLRAASTAAALLKTLARGRNTRGRSGAEN